MGTRVLEIRANVEQAYKDVELWVRTKERARREGRDVEQAMQELIHDVRASRYG